MNANAGFSRKGWILFAVIIVLTALQVQAQKKWVHYEY